MRFNKKILFTFTLFFLVIAAVFVIGELGVRLELLLSGKDGYIWIPDDYLGVTHAPNSRFIYKEDSSREYSTRNQANSLGLIGGQIAAEKPHSVFRVLILGDSFTEALQVAQDKCFCVGLENLLNNKRALADKTFQVINGGISSASPITEFLLYKRELAKLSPDIVILQIFPNDIFEDNKAGAMSVLDKDGYPIKINKFFIKGTSGKIESSNPPDFFYRLKRSFLNQSALFQCLSRAQKRPLKKSPFHKAMLDKPEFDDRNQFFIIQDDNPLFKNAGFRNICWDNSKKYILAIRDLARENNAQFYIFLIPMEGQLNLNRHSEHSSFSIAGRPSNYLNDALNKLCLTENIPYLDLLPLFEEHKEQGLYYPKDGHLNEIGHRLITQALFDFLENNRLIHQKTLDK